MKFYRPQPGDFRCRTFFAWLPVRFVGYTCWMERVKVLERYVLCRDELGFEFGEWAIQRRIPQGDDE